MSVRIMPKFTLSVITRRLAIFFIALGHRHRRASKHQQNGWSGHQEIAGGSDPERRIDAEGNTGDHGNTRGENTGSAVDAPEPGHGAGIDRGDQSHAGRKSKTHQQACRRQDKDTQRPARTRRSAPSRSNRSGRQNGNAPATFTMIAMNRDFRPGGFFHMGMQSGEGFKMWGKYVYQEIVPPERIACSSTRSPTRPARSPVIRCRIRRNSQAHPQIALGGIGRESATARERARGARSHGHSSLDTE
jgi:hypothetical protein